MWMQRKSAPALVAVLTLSVVGVGVLGFQGKAVDGSAGEVKTDKATVPADPSAAKPEAAPGRASTASAARDDKGLEAVQRRLTEELNQLRTERDASRKQYEETRQSLSAELFKKEGVLRKLEQKVAAERDRQARAIGSLDDERLGLEKAYRVLDPNHQLGKEHSEIRKLDTSMAQVQAEIEQRTNMFETLDARSAAEMINLRLGIESLRDKLKFEDEKWTRSFALLESAMAQLQRTKDAVTLKWKLPEIAEFLNPSAEEARTYRLETKLDLLMRELADLKSQLPRP